MLGLGRVGLGSLSLPSLLAARSASAQPSGALTPGFGRAKNCILVFLWGGPPQQDMWDMKPDAPEEIRSLFKPIRTSADGVEVSDQMPEFARIAKHVSIVRSVTHGSDNHEPSVYHMLTGQVDPSLVVPRNNRQRSHWPGPGAVVSCLKPSEHDVPSSVTLPRPIQHDGVKYAGTHAGWLGARHDPLELPDAGFANGRPVFDLGLPGGLDLDRIARRRGLLTSLEMFDRKLQNDPQAVASDAYRDRAFSLLTSGQARDAFRLDRETPKMRDRYGRNHYGEAFLLSRRLIEAGVRLVTINWMFFRPDGNPLNPWDNHGGTPALGGVTGFEMLKREYCLPSLDRSYSALIEDLHQRGMLDDTLVIAMGEFGRTPKINKTGGRDHWGSLQSVVLAGGGVRGGLVHGASDRDAAYPTENPVRPADLLSTMYGALGISEESLLYDSVNRPHPVATGTPLTSLFSAT